MTTEKPTPTQSGFVSANDRRVHWQYFGSGEREALCLLNGLAMSTESWYRFLPLLQDDHDVLLWDFLGQGQSSSPDEPYLIPELATYLALIMDRLGLAQLHLMGISYGGFVALDFARLFQERLHTLTLSGVLLSNERLFEMYEDLSLRFYRGGPEAFDLYTHYMYEKIFSEAFVAKIPPATLDTMRQRFYDRYWNETHCLIRLTEAQDPFFATIEEYLPQYQAIETPTLIMAGDQDRAIPCWVQRKLCDILPQSRFELVPECGHVVYLEETELFFTNLKRFARAKSTDFEWWTA